MDRKNVRMVKRRRHLGLALEAPPRGRVGQNVRQNLEGYRTVELAIKRAVDRAHPTLSELTLNAV